jgi:hypothetical protein
MEKNSLSYNYIRKYGIINKMYNSDFNRIIPRRSLEGLPLLTEEADSWKSLSIGSAAIGGKSLKAQARAIEASQNCERAYRDTISEINEVVEYLTI